VAEIVDHCTDADTDPKSHHQFGGIAAADGEQDGAQSGWLIRLNPSLIGAIRMADGDDL